MLARFPVLYAEPELELDVDDPIILANDGDDAMRWRPKSLRFRPLVLDNGI
jgi:hypothetical protein